jgi:hypothetical protein
MIGSVSNVSLAAGVPPGRGTEVTVEIGGIPILLETENADFCGLLERRYAGFVNPSATPVCRFAIHLEPPAEPSQTDAQVSNKGSLWRFERGDFRAAWDARSRSGWVHQSPNPYSIDAVLRIVHSLMLAEEGGFLVHAASAARRGRAHVFAGVSGAGKTTMSRLAPRDATLLTDEISYLRRSGSGYHAYGTPFSGELARAGANVTVPLSALYFLAKGAENRIEPLGRLAAVRALLRHILFFARDPDSVKRVFESAIELVSRVPATQFVFRPDERAWELVQ